jgi:hypothetical protein
MRTHTLSLGASQGVIYPRVWAALLIPVDVAFWLDGGIFVFFIPQP